MPKTITVKRSWVTAKSTISTFSTHDGSVKGFFLEPSGPSTSISGLNKRIPAGTYNLIAHSSTKYPGVYKLYNNIVPQSRAILIHNGNGPIDTMGCLLAGGSRSKDFVGGSVPKLKVLNEYIKKFIDTDGVQVVISDMDTYDYYSNAKLITLA